MKRFCLLVCLAMWAANVWAHKASDAYLYLTRQGAEMTGRWDIALRDLDFVLALDGDDDGRITWRELREREDAVYGYALQRLAFQADGRPCALQAGDMQVESHSDGRYAVLNFRMRCLGEPLPATVDYRLFFDVDPQHRGLLTATVAEQAVSAVLSPAQPRFQWPAQTSDHGLQTLSAFIAEGVAHIADGLDHMLFLLSLLLPAALVRDSATWRPQQGWRAIGRDVLTIVTAFTLAHSLTLSLTALQVIALPSRWVEAAIAASVAVAALHNIRPGYRHGRVWMAFGFGLIHGMGIAGVLLDMGLPITQKTLALLGFNLGVEVGQLALVIIALPPIALLSRYRYYPRWIMPAGSIGIVVIAMVWLVERSLDVRLQTLWYGAGLF